MRMTIMLPALLAAMLGPCLLRAESQTLTLPQALQRTLQHSAVLQRYPYQIRMAEAAQLQAGITPNPRLDVSLENILGTGESRGLTGAELTLSLSQQIEMGQKRQHRLALAAQQSQLEQDNYEIARLDALAGTSQLYLQLLQYQQLQTWAIAKIAREQTLLDIAEELSQAGNLPDADISRIKVRLLRSKIVLADIQRTRDSLRYTLAANWQAEPDFHAVSGDISTLPPLPALSSLQTQLQHSPSLQRFVTLERIAQSEQALTQANSKADVQLSAGVRRNAQLNDTALVLGFSMPLNVTDPNQGKRQTQLIKQQELVLQQQLSMKKLSLLVRQQWLTLEQLRDTVQAIATLLIPGAQQLQQASLHSYQQGQLDLLSLLSAEEELMLAQRELIESQSHFHLTLLELERLTGQALTLTTTAPVAALEPL